MSDNGCPVCGATLPVEAINIAEGVALCPDCGRLSRLREVVERQRPLNDLLDRPPRGCSLTQQGHEIVAKVRHTSLGGFLVLLGISAFWNGVTSVFVLVAFAGVYSNLVGPLPKWFPVPPVKDAMGLGMSLFLCVFLIPFVLIGLAMVFAAVHSLLGTTVAVIGEYDAYVATGVLMFKWRRRFDPQQVRKVELVAAGRNDNGRPSGHKIAIHADQLVKFGSTMPEDRRDWLYAVLHELLMNPDPQRQRELVLRASGGWNQFDEG